MPGRPRRDCELEPYVDGFRRRLLSLGYTPGTVANQLAVVGRLGRWLAVRGRSVDRFRLGRHRRCSSPIRDEMADVIACFGRDWCSCGTT